MEANGQRDSTKTSSRDKWWNCPRGSNERVRKILLAEQNNRSSVGRSVGRSVGTIRSSRSWVHVSERCARYVHRREEKRRVPEGKCVDDAETTRVEVG